MQALENFEKEVGKAFEKMEADMEQHKEIFKRLEEDLKTVKTFEQHDNALYTAIRDAYNLDEDHCQGMIAAVNAIYNLGFSNGFKQGAEYAQKGE